jgi:23S rRNA (uridine2552-2'-O)-methyltransferase
LKLAEARRDHYRKLAREQGYKSRAAYKLIEACKRYRLIKLNDKVIDLGAAPGGWLQVSSRLVGESGLVIGVDIAPIEFSLNNLRTINADIFESDIVEKIKAMLTTKANVILSDIAPRVSGVWELDHYKQVELTFRVISLIKEFLRRGGNAMLKIFEGERLQEVKKSLEETFSSVIIMKPKASRRQSSELYFICLGYFESNSRQPSGHHNLR